MTETDSLTRAIRHLAVDDVYLHETSVTKDASYHPKVDSTPLTIQLRHKPREDIRLLTFSDRRTAETATPLRVYRFYIDTGLRLVCAENKEKNTINAGMASEKPSVRAEVSATFIAEYRLIKDGDLDESALQEFATQNVMYHVWPYWREYVQSMSSRLRLPDIILPMFRLPERYRVAAEGEAAKRTP